MIMFCTCFHPWQDSQYGHNRRVFNRTVKGRSGTTGYRCTVCDRETMSEAPKKPKSDDADSKKKG